MAYIPPETSVCPPKRSTEASAPIFSEETMESLRELGAVLEPIYRRLEEEGYVIKGGKIVKEPIIKT